MLLKFSTKQLEHDLKSTLERSSRNVMIHVSSFCHSSLYLASLKTENSTFGHSFDFFYINKTLTSMVKCLFRVSQHFSFYGVTSVLFEETS